MSTGVVRALVSDSPQHARHHVSSVASCLQQRALHCHHWPNCPQRRGFQLVCLPELSHSSLEQMVSVPVLSSRSPVPGETLRAGGEQTPVL